MAFRFVMLGSGQLVETWAERIGQAVPQVEAVVCPGREDALQALPGARAAYGKLDPQLLAAAPSLEWLACPAAGPTPDFYFDELVQSSVQVTNMRGIYNDHISAHIMAFVLAFSRDMQRYLPAQFGGNWAKGAGFEDYGRTVYLPEAVALVIGVGGIGAETARHCAHFGMRVIGIDPRVGEPPEGVAELYGPDALDEHLGRADFVIMTAPQTPQTEGLVGAALLERMKDSAYFINIGRGTNVRLADLDRALRDGQIAGAALDVFEEEPLPADHPLWTAPNFLMTPHVAAFGPYLDERRLNLLIDNCRRLDAGETLVNVVDKENWF